MLVEDRVDPRGAGGLLGAGARGHALHPRADAHDPARALLELGAPLEALGVEPRPAGVARAEERLDLPVVGVALAHDVAERAQQVGGRRDGLAGGAPSAWPAASAWWTRRSAAAAARCRRQGRSRGGRRRGRRAAARRRRRVRVIGPKQREPEPVVVVGRERDAPALGLDPEEPARRRRDADRAAAVGAQRARDHAGGDRRGAAAARAAGAALRVPRVAGRAPRLRLGEVRPQRQLGHVRLADHDGARGAQAAHDLAVGGGGLADHTGAVRGQLAGDVHVVLDRDRHAEQRCGLAARPGAPARRRPPPARARRARRGTRSRTGRGARCARG